MIRILHGYSCAVHPGEQAATLQGALQNHFELCNNICNFKLCVKGSNGLAHSERDDLRYTPSLRIYDIISSFYTYK